MFDYVSFTISSFILIYTLAYTAIINNHNNDLSKGYLTLICCFNFIIAIISQYINPVNILYISFIIFTNAVLIIKFIYA